MENRVIEFSVWDKPTKSWLKTYFADPINGYKALPYQSISQFTGLLDREGKEIWEGDIIEINHYKINIPWWKDLRHKVEIDQQAQKDRDSYNTVALPIIFHNGQFAAKNDYLCFDSQNLRYWGHTKYDRTHWCDTEEKSWGYAIVGNIYENPELISNGRDQ